MQARRDLWTLLYGTLFACMFVGYPVLSSALGALDAYARELSVAYRAFVLFGSLFLIRFAVKRVPAEAWKSPVAGAFCVLWLLLLARFTWDSSFVPIPLALPWFDYFLMIVGAVLIPTVGLFHVPSERAFDLARRIIVCGGVLAGFFLIAAVLRIVFESDSIAAFRRLGTDALNPISLGNVGVALVTASLLAQRPPRAEALVPRVLDNAVFRGVAGALGGFLAVASASKGPIVALIGVIVLWQLARAVRAGNVWGLIVGATRLALVFAGMVLLALFLALFANVRVVDRFVDFAVDSSTSDRVGMMTRAILQFESSPWIGDAFVETQSRFYPHNLFVEVLMAVGIPGLCALIVVLIAGFRAALRVLASRHDWIVLLCAQYQIGLMFSGSIYFSAEFWVGLTAVIAADRLLAGEKAAQPRAPPATLSLA